MFFTFSVGGLTFLFCFRKFGNWNLVVSTASRLMGSHFKQLTWIDWMVRTPTAACEEVSEEESDLFPSVDPLAYFCFAGRYMSPLKSVKFCLKNKKGKGSLSWGGNKKSNWELQYSGSQGAIRRQQRAARGPWESLNGIRKNTRETTI